MVIYEDNDSWRVYLILKLEDLTIFDLLHYNPSFSISEDVVVKLLYRILCSVRYLHKAGVMHRDLKPANFLMDADFNVKLGDFGMARTFNPDPARESLKDLGLDKKEVSQALV